MKKGDEMRNFFETVNNSNGGYIMKIKFKKIITMILAIVMSLTVSIPSFAATNTTANNDDYMKIIEQLTPYLAQNIDGTLYLKSENLDIDINDYNAILDNLKVVNSMISKGYLVSDARGNITITEKYVSKLKTNSSSPSKVIVDRNKITVIENSVSGGADVFLD